MLNVAVALCVWVHHTGRVLTLGCMRRGHQLRLLSLQRVRWRRAHRPFVTGILDAEAANRGLYHRVSRASICLLLVVVEKVGWKWFKRLLRNLLLAPPACYIGILCRISRNSVAVWMAWSTIFSISCFPSGPKKHLINLRSLSAALRACGFNVVRKVRLILASADQALRQALLS